MVTFMRSELLPPEVDDHLVELMANACTRLELGGSPTEVAGWLAAESGYDVDAEWLHGVFGAVDPAETSCALQVAAEPALLCRVRPTRDELVEIVERLMPTSPNWDAGAAPWWAALLDAHVPHPAALNLIFYPPSDVDPATWDAEAIVEHALAYRPIAL